MTLKVMRNFGIEIEQKVDNIFLIKGKQSYRNPEEYCVEGDWSGAAFWVVLGAINGRIEIKGLERNSLQADCAILDVLSNCKANYEWKGDSLIVNKSDLQPFKFDATNCPDLFPILATLAASIGGTSEIIGTHRLINKESNRAHTVKKEFSKLGLSIDLDDDKMIIYGKEKLNSSRVHANHDHRIAMACGIASCLTLSGIEIENSEAISKSYPEFWSVLLNN
jgi:3-phosphoshikimate 1-carboxyvinyltransferase